MTQKRAIWIPVAVACLVFAASLANGWAGDDLAVIRDNAAAHSLGGALGNWFAPYWPPPLVAAGLYRPLIVLSYAIDWVIGGGEVWVFHLTNVVLHAGTTALVVLVALAWLPRVGAAAAGLIFAVHPVHVEAVSNVVGRAEILAAAALLGAVLMARQYRRSDPGLRSRLWFVGSLLTVTIALLAKEHAAIAVVILGLDHFFDPEPARRSAMGSLYAGALAVTAAWLFLWRAIVGGFVGTGATAVFYDLTVLERAAMMLPVQLDVIRLLIWPMDLSSDYNPQVIPFRTSFTAIAALGLVMVSAVVGLGLAAYRRAPAVSFGILVAAASYAPTSNLMFASGVVLAERALYLPVLFPALAAGWLLSRVSQERHVRLAVGSLVVVSVVFGGRTVTRTPFWRDPITPVIEEATDHPESYRARLLLGDLIARAGDSTRALSEYLVSGALFDRDPFVPIFAARMADAVGRRGVALAASERAYEIAPREPVVARSLVQAQLSNGLGGAAVRTSLEGVQRAPASVAAAETLVGALRATDAEEWRRLLAEARLAWLIGRPIEAIDRLDSLSADLAASPPSVTHCPEIEIARPTLRILTPSLGPGRAERWEAAFLACDGSAGHRNRA